MAPLKRQTRFQNLPQSHLSGDLQEQPEVVLWSLCHHQRDEQWRVTDAAHADVLQETINS